MKKTAKLFICTVLLLVLPFIFTACGKTTIDMEDYVTVTYGSYNTMGTVSLDVDYSGLNAQVDPEVIQKYVSKFPDTKKMLEWGFSFTMEDIIYISFRETYSRLSNGDKVIVDVKLTDDFASMGETLESMQKALKINLSNTELEFTVSGLQEAKILDVVSIVADYVVFTGADGGAKAEVVIPQGTSFEIDEINFSSSYNSDNLRVVYNNQYQGDLYFEVTDGTNLSNGDTIKIWCNINYMKNKDWKSAGYDVIKHDTEITVSSLGEYLTSKDVLTADLKAQIDASLIEYLSNTKNFRIVDYYWGELKNSVVTDNLAADSEKLFVYGQYDMFGMTFTKRCEATIIKNADNTYDISWSCTDILSESELYPANYDIEIIEF